MTIHRTAMLALSTLTLLAACTSPSDDDAADAPNVEVRFLADDTLRSEQLVLTRLDVWVAEVVFDADAEDRSISVTEPLEAKVDALATAERTSAVGIVLEPGTYGSPYLGVELWDDGEEPALVLEGTLDDVPIRFVFNSGEVFEAEAERLVVEADASYAVTFDLDPRAWFNGVDAASLNVGADGVAEISETSNPAVFDRVADLLDETTDGRFPGGVGEDTADTGW
jgi:hypothetical protein